MGDVDVRDIEVVVRLDLVLVRSEGLQDRLRGPELA